MIQNKTKFEWHENNIKTGQKNPWHNQHENPSFIGPTRIWTWFLDSAIIGLWVILSTNIFGIKPPSTLKMQKKTKKYINARKIVKNKWIWQPNSEY